METTVFSDEIEVNLAAGVDMADITGSLTAIEHEAGVMEDLRRAINHDNRPRNPNVAVTIIGGE